jgi:hypothetical protein
MDFIAWIAYALVFIGLKHVDQLGVLLWFFVKNYDNGVTSFEFLVHECYNQYWC